MPGGQTKTRRWKQMGLDGRKRWEWGEDRTASPFHSSVPILPSFPSVSLPPHSLFFLPFLLSDSRIPGSKEKQTGQFKTSYLFLHYGCWLNSHPWLLSLLLWVPSSWMIPCRPLVSRAGSRGRNRGWGPDPHLCSDEKKMIHWQPGGWGM